MNPHPHTPPPSAAWHALSYGDALQRQGSSHHGLSFEEAQRRLAQYGANRLAEMPPRPAWLKFADQFKSMLIVILLITAGLALLVGDVKDMVVILIVIVFNAVLGFYQEHRAEQSLAALKKMLALKARVRRDGQPSEVAAETLVPGDIVLLEAGDKVPADGRLIQSHSVEIDESTLTGESHPVAKHSDAVTAAATPLAERINMALMNTVVTRGRAEMLVTATAGQTEMGRIAVLMQQAPQAPTPLQRQLDRLGKRLALIAGGVVGLIFVLALYQGEPLASAALTAITLAVAAIPEGLPAVVTVTLALGMRRMAAQRAVVKRLSAVETLGCTTVICSDKTGTLTLNQMTARAFLHGGRHYVVSGEGYSTEGNIEPEGGAIKVAEHAVERAAERAAAPGLGALLLPAALCNDSRVQGGQLIGDPTEGALAALAAKGGIDALSAAEHLPRIAEIPFDSANKFMVTFHHDGERVRVFVKGAPDVLLARCAAVVGEDGEQRLESAMREDLVREIDAMASRGLRVLAIATSSLAARDFDPAGELMAHVRDLTLQGLVGIVDPPRKEAREAIALCKAAGIQVKMITGDHQATAAAIARELGLTGEVIEGRDLDRMDETELARRIAQVTVFARVAPEHKVRIVKALQRAGHVVAMTGDGVNDAPALRAADIGVAMGRRGTEVARAAAAIILVDDNFTTLVTAVRDGRRIRSNLQRAFAYLVAFHIPLVVAAVVVPMLGRPLLLEPVHLILLELVLHPVISLAFESDEPAGDVMDVPPRNPQAGFVDRSLVVPVIGAIVVATATVAVYLARGSGSVGQERDARALGLALLLVGQQALIGVVRRGQRFNRMAFASTLAVGVVTLAIFSAAPLRSLLHVAPLPAVAFVAVLISALIIPMSGYAFARRDRGATTISGGSN